MEITREVVKIDSGRQVQAPLLLAFPLGAIAMASLCLGSRCSWERLAGTTLLLVLTAICARQGQRRVQIELRPNSREMLVRGKLASFAPDAHIVLQQCDPSSADAKSFPYEATLVDGTGLRQLILRAPLAVLLNDLHYLREHWQIGVSTGPLADKSLQRVIAKTTDVPLDCNWGNTTIACPSRDDQVEIARILCAISILALIVVVLLTTGQLSRRGEISALGMILGALLVLVPAFIAIHLILGRFLIVFGNATVRIEHRRCIFGTKLRIVSTAKLKGIWLIQEVNGGSREVLLLNNDSFSSIPVTQAAWPNWQAAFEWAKIHEIAGGHLPG